MGPSKTEIKVHVLSSICLHQKLLRNRIVFIYQSFWFFQMLFINANMYSLINMISKTHLALLLIFLNQSTDAHIFFSTDLSPDFAIVQYNILWYGFADTTNLIFIGIYKPIFWVELEIFSVIFNCNERWLFFCVLFTWLSIFILAVILLALQLMLFSYELLAFCNFF